MDDGEGPIATATRHQRSATIDLGSMGRAQDGPVSGAVVIAR